MSESEVKISLFDGGLVLKKWEKHCHTNLSEIIETVKDLKQSLNSYLTESIESSSKGAVELVDISDEEDEEDCDGVSGFIKGITIVNEKSSGCEKRKLNYSKQTKKLKK